MSLCQLPDFDIWSMTIFVPLVSTDTTNSCAPAGTAIFRETMLLTIIGAAIGLLFGCFLEGFVVVTAEVDYVMFGRDIHWLSYLLGFGCTIAFSVLVLLLLGRKIDAIDMAESLKSVE